MPKRMLSTRSSRGVSVESTSRLVREVALDHGVGRRERALVLDEVAEARVLFLADRRLEADRLLRDLEHRPHLLERHLELLGDLLGGAARGRASATQLLGDAHRAC